MMNSNMLGLSVSLAHDGSTLHDPDTLRGDRRRY